MSFRGSETSRGIFPSGKVYLVVVHYPTWWIPPLRFAAVGMTAWLRFYGFAYCFYSISRCPAALIRLALGRASFPQGKLLYRAFGWCHSTTRVVFETWHGDESSPLHCVIPFIRTGYNRKAPGTAHRPFPTVSLKGGLFQPPWFKSVRLLSRVAKRDRTRNAKLSIVNCQFDYSPTWKKLFTVRMIPSSAFASIRNSPVWL